MDDYLTTEEKLYRIERLIEDLRALSPEAAKHIIDKMVNRCGVEATKAVFNTLDNALQAHPKVITRKLYLLDTGARKILVMKAIRNFCNCDVKMAREAAETVPTCLDAVARFAMSDRTKRELAAELEMVGALVEFRNKEQNR